MKLQLVPAGHGALWVRHGFQAFLRRPLSFASMFGMFSLAVLLTGLVPLAGTLIGFGAMPLMSLGFMIATHQLPEGRAPGPAVFWLPLRGDPARKRSLLKLCLTYALCLTAMLSVWIWLDAAQLETYRAAMASASSSPEAMNAMAADGQLLLTLFTPLLFVSLLSVPFWHAPALVHWGGLTVGKAIFFSTMACWRNRGAFFVYGLTWIGVLMVFSMLSTLLLALLGGSQAVAALLIMPIALLLSAAFYTSLYFTFADCFEMPSTPPADEKEPAP